MAHRGRKNADEALLQALACGATVETAAAKAGVSRRTATRRLADPEFQARLRAFRSDLVQRTAGALTAAGQEFVRALFELLKDSSSSVRLGAIRCGLEYGARLRESGDLEERVAALEQRVSPGMGRSGSG